MWRLIFVFPSCLLTFIYFCFHLCDYDYCPSVCFISRSYKHTLENTWMIENAEMYLENYTYGTKCTKRLNSTWKNKNRTLNKWFWSLSMSSNNLFFVFLNLIFQFFLLRPSPQANTSFQIQRPRSVESESFLDSRFNYDSRLSMHLDVSSIKSKMCPDVRFHINTLLTSASLQHESWHVKVT